MNRGIRIVLLVSWVVALAACGGGGDDLASGPTSTFEGDWHFVAVRAAVGDFTTFWGAATGDAAGGAATVTSANADGAITTDVASTAAATIEPGGGLTFASGADTLRGGIALAGDVAVVSGVSGGRPMLMVFLRKAGVFDAASLSGLYQAIRLRRVLSVPLTSAGRDAGIEYDGVGTYTDTGGSGRLINREGDVAVLTFGSGSYDVLADGRYQEVGRRGGVLLGGAAVIQAGRLTTGSDALIEVQVPVSTAATNARFAGEYAVVGMQYDFAAPAYRATRARMSADGAGAGTVSGTQFVSSTPVGLPSSAVTYAVGADGTLDLSLPGGDTVRGAVSPDGRLAILGGATENGMDPAFFVLVRLD